MKVLASLVLIGVLGGGISEARGQANVVAPPSTSVPSGPSNEGVKTPAVTPFKVERGAFTVAMTDVTVRDEARGKDLDLRVRVPVPAKGAEAPKEGWPLLVFSHGAGGSRDAFGGLLDLLASQGYASVAPTHSDSIAQRYKRGETRALMEIGTPEGRVKLLAQVKLGERVKDCVFIIDHAEVISAAVVKAGGGAFTIDKERLAIAGHSAGAFTAQLCAGVRVRAAAVGEQGIRFTSIAEDRFKAAVIISGQGTASRSLGEDSWSKIKIPILVFSGSLDTSPPNMGSETPETSTHPYTKSRGTAAGGPPAYLMFIEGAAHSTYQGKAITRIGNEKPTTDAVAVGDATNAAVLTFLNAYVRGDAPALGVMKSTKLAETIPGKVRYEQK